jgi:uncharacterized protein YjdB
MKSFPDRLARQLSSPLVFPAAFLTFTLSLFLTSCAGLSSLGPSVTKAPTKQDTLSLAPATIDFGTVQLNSTATGLISVTNVGPSAETIESATVVTNPIFSIQSWTGPITLDPGQTVQLQTIFAPQSAGNYSGTLTLALPQPLDPINIPLIGSASAENNPPPIGVSLSPNSAALQSGQSQQFAAAVTGTSNTAITWTAVFGHITASGAYTAPTGTSQSYDTVSAVSVADPTKSATASVTVTSASSVVGVSLSPTSVALQSGQSQQFTSAVTGTSNTAVTWTAVLGSITSSGFYTAPDLVDQIVDTVSAISAVDPAKYASVSVTVSVNTGSVDTFYVDPVNGSDSYDGSQPTHGAGSVGPWQSICKPDASLALNTAGAVVHLAAGTYDKTNQMSQGAPCAILFTDGNGVTSLQMQTTHVGTASQRIVFIGPTAYGVSGAKIIGNWYSYGNYVDVWNIEGTNPNGGAFFTFGQYDHTVNTKGNFSTFRFNYVHDVGNSNCTSVGGGATALSMAFRVHDSVFDSNIIDKSDVPYGCAADAGNGGYCMYVQGPHNTVTNNMASNCEGGGLSVYHNVCNELVAFNVFVHNGVRGFEIADWDRISPADCSSGNDYTTVVGNVAIDNGWTCGAASSQNQGVVGGYDFFSAGVSSTHNTFAYNAAYNNWSATGNRNCTSNPGTQNTLVLHNSATPLGIATNLSGSSNTGLVTTFGDSVVPAASPPLGGTTNFQPLTSGPLYDGVPATANATYCAGSPGFTNPCLPIPNIAVAARNALTNIGAY